MWTMADKMLVQAMLAMGDAPLGRIEGVALGVLLDALTGAFPGVRFDDNVDARAAAARWRAQYGDSWREMPAELGPCDERGDFVLHAEWFRRGERAGFTCVVWQSEDRIPPFMRAAMERHQARDECVASASPRGRYTLDLTVASDGRHTKARYVELARVLGDMLAERECQDAKWGGPDHDDAHDANDWIEFIWEHAAKARNALFTQATPTYRRRLIEVAALALAAVESLDRQRASESEPHV